MERSINATEIKKAEKDLNETLECINNVKKAVQSMVQFRHVNEIGFFTVMDETRYHHGTFHM